MDQEIQLSISDPSFEVRSTMKTIKDNQDLLKTLTGNQRRSLREQNKKLRAKVDSLRGIVMMGYSEEYQSCREIGHVWLKQFAELESDDVVYRVLLCERCNAERTETFNSNGHLLSRRYNHPEGYLFEGEIAGVLKNSGKDFWRGIEYLSFQSRRALEPGD